MLCFFLVIAVCLDVLSRVWQDGGLAALALQRDALSASEQAEFAKAVEGNGCGSTCTGSKVLFLNAADWQRARQDVPAASNGRWGGCAPPAHLSSCALPCHARLPRAPAGESPRHRHPQAEGLRGEHQVVTLYTPAGSAAKECVYGSLHLL